ncbi:MAG: restriction endonuclease subunit S [Pseudobutyrivibrio sp.]|uniref:restriction endonuclease subunit S n=1 Tax=Pseudobutyrivibrio sp. TaxID=2014367 RepID=UPI0025F651A8|nr:restriction endonuclease subunit S [Pseudobutyrivibrio sp.]MBQ6462216.1 restriction endonuclease subunit S [Pseudobutyrivibrio sp.]
MKFLDVFNEVEKGNYALTDEVIYNSIQNNDEMIPLYGGNKTHSKPTRYVSSSAVTKKGKPITIFDGEGIIISLDGSAGSMTYKKGERFALNHHAGFITLKEKGVVRLEYFALFYQNFLQRLSISDGSKTLSLTQLYNTDFEFPTYDLQCRILDKILPIKRKIDGLEGLITNIEKIENRQLSVDYKIIEKRNIPIADVIDCMSGNTGLSEEFIYNNYHENSQLYKVLSGATLEDNGLGFIPLCDIDKRKMRVFDNSKDGLLVVRKGRAGATQYLPKNYYTINDDAYILSVKDEYIHKLDLRWLAIQYKTEFMNYASASDNGTWNKTGFFENVEIDIPSILEQKIIVDYYDKIVKVKSTLNSIKEKYERLLMREVV